MWGRIIGLILGGAFLKLPGAAVGFYLGYLFDKKMRLLLEKHKQGFQNLNNLEAAQKRALFSYTCFSVMGYIAKSNGRVQASHIQAASQLMYDMDFSSEQKQAAQDAFRSGKESDFPFDEVLKDFHEHFVRRDDLMQFFLEIQIQMAFSDGHLSEQERRILSKIAKAIGIGQTLFKLILKRYEAEFKYGHQRQQQQGSAQPNELNRSGALQILGLPDDADAKQIKQAYRKLMAQHHPDKLVSQGLPPEMMQAAVKKSQDIQAAYQYLK